MKIYHGTHTGVLHDILASGLKPRGQGKGNWPDAPSHDEYVYLTNAYPLYFAVASVPDKSDAFPAVLEIDLDRLEESRLCPDEDFVAQALWKEKMRGEMIQDPALRRARSVGGLAKRIQPLAYQAVWRTSLEYLGQVAYWGSIPADAVTRYAVVDPQKAPRLLHTAMQPTITIDNYTWCGRHYRSLVAFLFDGAPIEDEFADAEASLPLEYILDMERGQQQMQAQRIAGVQVVVREASRNAQE